MLERTVNASVKSAVRVLDLMEMLSVAPCLAGVSEIARRLGIPKSSAHMLLSTLEGRGYLVSDDARRFRLNPMLGGEGRSWIGGVRAVLLRTALPVMKRLVQATGESSFLAVPRDRTTLEYIGKALSSHEVRCDAELGQPRPLHSTSFGLVILAFQAPDRTASYLSQPRLERLTQHTPTDPQWLRRELDAVRRAGHAVTRDTNAVGASGVATPILLADGTVAALNVTAPSSRFDAVLGRATTLLVDAAAEIGRKMVGNPRKPGD